VTSQTNKKVELTFPSGQIGYVFFSWFTKEGAVRKVQLTDVPSRAQTFAKEDVAESVGKFCLQKEFHSIN